MKIVSLIAGVAAAALIAGTASAQSTFTNNGTTNPNNGTAGPVSFDTFTLRGSVTPDCSFFTGGASSDVSFGNLPIVARSDQGLDNMFDLVGTPSAVITSSTAGCNTASNVSLDVTHMTNTANTGGFDTAQFQDFIGYTAVANYTAGPRNSEVIAAPVTLSVPSSPFGNEDSNQHGAWKSAMSLTFTLSTPARSLISGQYAGTTILEISVL